MMNTLKTIYLKVSTHSDMKGVVFGAVASIPQDPEAELFYQPLEVPEGFEPDVFNCPEAFYSFKYLWGMSPMSKEYLPLEWQNLIVNRILCANRRCAIADLMVTNRRGKMRSEYRLSLAKQVEVWLGTPSHELKYDLPLSPRQLDTIMKPSYHYKKASDRVYYGYYT